jgi:formylglycine-generating enzyme required for sulfatase activity
MPDREALYDLYLDALLSGVEEAPATFLARQGFGPDDELLALLEGLYANRRASDAIGATGATPDGAQRVSTDPLDREGGSAGRRIGDYLLLRRIGRGGMGEVYLARQESLGREVALKLISPEAAGSPVAAARLEREARAAAKLHHPGIVTVHAVGENRGTRYLAMELVDGKPLDEVLEEGAIGVARALRWGSALSRALDYAHSRGVIHRDVKPSNILITPDDRPLLVDFGLAREIDAGGVTLSEGFAGSPFYAAPEQIGRAGGLADGRTDVYALGVVLYQCLTGRVPFDPGTLERVLHAILTEDPARPRALNPAIPADVELVVLKAMEKDPARRYATAGALADDLEAILENRPVSVRRAGRVERMVKWARRNPARATVVVSVVGAMLVIGAVLAGHSLARGRARRIAAAAALDEARALVASWEEAYRSMRDLETNYELLSSNRVGRYYTEQEDREVDLAEEAVLRARRRRQQIELGVLDLTDRAARLGADPDDAAAVRGELYSPRYAAAEALADAPGQSLYRGLALANDPRGTIAARMSAGARLALETEPGGATVHLYRRVMLSELVEAGEPRLVHVPLRDRAAPEWCTEWALRVVRAAGDLAPGDHIVRVAGLPVRGTMLVSEVAPGSPGAAAGVRRWDRLVRAGGQAVKDAWDIEELLSARGAGVGELVFARDGEEVVVRANSLADVGVVCVTPAEAAEQGGAPANVWRDGGAEEMVLPQGLSVRTTAAPMPVVASALAGTTPMAELALEPGNYVALVSAPGRETLRLALVTQRSATLRVRVALPPVGAAPEGYICVAHAPQQYTVRLPYWIMEREVTMAEYYEFVNDPDTLAEIDQSPVPIRFPRDGEHPPEGERGPDGRFVIPSDWRPDWPVLNISWHDAKAYAAWMTRRARAAGRAETYDLPESPEWELAAAVARGCLYPFGDRFRPKWVSSVRARPRADPEPPMSFPIDESCLGVFDLCGSISEWTDSAWRPGTEYRRYAGGNWAIGVPRDFTVFGGNGLFPGGTSGMIGFRLIMRGEESPQ